MRRLGWFGGARGLALLLLGISLPPAPSKAAPPARVPGRDVLATLRKAHPRLIATDEVVPELRKTLEMDARARRIHAELRRAADELLGRPPVEYRLVGPRLLGVSREALRRIYTLATLFRLEGDRKYLDRTIVELEAVASFADWHPSHFLDTAEMTHAVAIGYDWLHPFLSSAQRRRLVQAIKQKGLEPAEQAYQGRAAWRFWVNARHNWNQVCNGGIVLGALAVAEDEPELSRRIIEYALASLPRAMAEFAPDGGWAEGPGYWNYATRYNVYLLAGLETALGTTFDLEKAPGFSATGLFPIYFVGPTGETFNYADARPGRAGSSPHLFWMARCFNQPIYSWAAQATLGKADPLALWWYRPAGPGPQAAGLPLDRLFAGIDVAFLRGAWENSDTVYIGFKGGDNKANHSHLDLGTFVLDALGKRWAVDLGGDDYNLPGYFGKQRWTYYRLRTEGHNTLVLNGANQDSKAAATLMGFRATPAAAGVVADLSAAYAKHARRVWRGVFLRQRQVAVIQDEIDAERPATVEWLMHTPAQVSLDGSRAILTQGDARMAVVALQPSGARFETASAQPPKPEAANRGISKLVLRLALPAGASTIAVELIPYRGAEIPTPQPTTARPLREWLE